MKIWTELEITALQQRYSVEPTLILANEFGVSPTTVARKAYNLGLSKQVTPKGQLPGKNSLAHVWTEEEDSAIRRWWPLIAKRVHRKQGKNSEWLAKQLGVSRAQVRHRAATLNLKIPRAKEPPWTEPELDILGAYLHLSLESIQRRLKRRGFPRTLAAIAMQRFRKCGGFTMATGAYSARGLAELLGCSGTSVLRWIKNGMLKATPRGTSKNVFAGPGDQWLITPNAARDFIIENASLIGQNVNMLWFIDLLTNKKAG